MIHLLDIQLGQEVLGWQVDWHRTVLPSLVGGIPMALQHKQRCLLMAVQRMS